VVGLTVTPSSLNLLPGEITTLSAQVTVDGAPRASAQVNWASNNGSVATVTQAGEVTAQSPGSASVIATTVVEGIVAADTVAVVVDAVEFRIEGLADVMRLGTTTQLSGVVIRNGSPQSATVAWSSGTPDLISVDAEGLAEALAVGEASVIAETTLNGRPFADTASTNIREIVFEISDEETSLQPDETLQLQVTATRDGTPVFPQITWESLDASIATVDGAGLLTPVAVGEAPIVASATVSSVEVADTVLIEVVVAKIAEDVVVTDSVLTLQSDSAEVAEGTLRFTKAAGTEVAIESGDILVGSDGSGFLKRVESVNDAGNEIVVQTTQASLDEAILEGDLEGSYEIDLAQPIGLAPGMVADPNLLYLAEEPYLAEGVSVTPEGTLRVDGVNLDYSIPTPGGSVQVAVDVNGSIDFSPVFNFKLKIKPWGVKRFKVSAGGSFGVDADVAASLSGSIDVTKRPTRTEEWWDPKKNKTRKRQVERPIASFKLKRFSCNLVGIVPVCWEILLEFWPYVTVTPSFHGAMQGSFDTGAYVEVGVDYRNASGWSPIAVFNGYSNTKNLGVDLGGALGVRFGIKPQIKIKFYDVAGPFVGLDPAVALTAGVENWEAYLDAQALLDFEAGIAITILSKKLAEFSQTWPLTKSGKASLSWPLGELELTPNPAVLGVGETLQMQAGVRSFVDDQLYPPPTNIEWATGAPGIASISGSGLVTGVSRGETQVGWRIPGTNLEPALADVRVVDPCGLSIGTLTLTADNAGAGSGPSGEGSLSTADCPAAGGQYTELWTLEKSDSDNPHPRIEVVPTGSSSLAPSLRLLDSNGNVVRSSIDLGDRPGAVILWWGENDELPNGTYTLEVSGSGSGSTGAYRVTFADNRCYLGPTLNKFEGRNDVPLNYSCLEPGTVTGEARYTSLEYLSLPPGSGGNLRIRVVGDGFWPTVRISPWNDPWDVQQSWAPLVDGPQEINVDTSLAVGPWLLWISSAYPWATGDYDIAIVNQPSVAEDGATVVEVRIVDRAAEERPLDPDAPGTP
jgi:uncharacterized protein YjdB